MRNLLPPSLRLSPLQWVVVAVLVAWGAWMVVSPRLARRRRIEATTDLINRQQRLLDLAMLRPSLLNSREHARRQVSASLAFFQAVHTAKSRLGEVAHQDLDRLKRLTDDFVWILEQGRQADSFDQVPDHATAVVIPKETLFRSPMPKRTNALGLVWVPDAEATFNQANLNLINNIVLISLR